MRTIFATLLVASLFSILTVAAAQAAPTEVDVRIEGKSETLFEGPIWTEGHDVKASSDSEERSCDGTNNGQHPTPGPTPTAAAADAMSIIGETFDGQWYPSFDDYFITRWGPDAQSAAAGAYWGVLVNNVFTSIGGCQYELGPENEVLWDYNAFQGKPFLALLPASAGYAAGIRPLTATAEIGRPFEVEVDGYGDVKEGTPPARPERSGSAPYEGADVSPVQTSAKGFERVEAASPATVTTGQNGRASITFTEPGWHRIQASAVNGKGEEEAVRSNRLDVCVTGESSSPATAPLEGAVNCSQLPAGDEVRTPPQPKAEVKHEEPASSAAPADTASTTATQPAPVTSPPSVQTPRLDGQGAARGLVGVSWQVLEAGVGVRSWTIASKMLGASGGYVTRATGTSATAALVKLPAGDVYELQFTVTDDLGRAASTHIANVLVPYDDRWSGLHYRGHWRRLSQPDAWLNTVSRGGSGAEVSMQLGAGRPVLELDGTSASARIEVRAGAHRQVLTIGRGSIGSERLITAADRSHPGTVTLRVLKGTVNLDGVAVER
jgi:hypothetical protein